jgi:hypothetical protein
MKAFSRLDGNRVGACALFIFHEKITEYRTMRS